MFKKAGFACFFFVLAVFSWEIQAVILILRVFPKGERV